MNIKILFKIFTHQIDILVSLEMLSKPIFILKGFFFALKNKFLLIIIPSASTFSQRRGRRTRAEELRIRRSNHFES